MENFDIEKKFLEIDAIADNSKYVCQFVDEFKPIKQHYIEKKDEVGIQKIQSIIDVLNFKIEDGEQKGVTPAIIEFGETRKHPENSGFSEETFKIIENELLKTTSIKLKAHYSDFLWFAKKDYTKAKIAIETYLQLVGVYEEKDI